jgi:hypothetical protein
MIPTSLLAHPLPRLLTLFAGLLLISTNVFAYEEDTHFSMTYVICRSVGFTADEALIVAAVDQGMDDSSGTVANGGIGGVIPNVDEEWKWHALDGYGYTQGGSMHASGILARRDLFFQAALKEKDPRNRLILLGVFFHYQQDTWGHRHHYSDAIFPPGTASKDYDPNHLSQTNYTTYNTPTGHAPDGHAPDRPPFDPVAAVYDLETGIVYARTFLQQALGRQPGAFLANYQPQGGKDDANWNDPRNGAYFHQIDLSVAAPNTARAYVLNLIRAQINIYQSSVGGPRYFPRFTPDEADLDKNRAALNQVAKNFEPYRSAGIPNPTIGIPTTAQKVAAGFTNMTTPWVEALFSSATSKAKQVTTALNSDGRLEAFYVGMDNNLYHNYQIASSADGWSGQITLGGSGAANQISAIRDKAGKLEVFYIGTDTKVYRNSQGPNGPGGWNGATYMNGLGKQVVVAANGDGRLEIFYIGTDNNIYHNYETSPGGSWSGQIALGGAAQQITVAANADGRLEVFYVGTDSKVYHNYQSSGGWSGQLALGGAAKQITASLDKSSGKLMIFYVGTDNNIYYNSQGPNGPGGWNGQASFGGAAKQITAAANSDGRLEVFYVGTDNNIYHNYQTASGGASWSGQIALGGAAKQINAILNDDGGLEIFYIGADDVIYRNSQGPGGPGGWNGQEPL